MAEIYSVDVVGLGELQAALMKAPAIVIEELDKAMTSVVGNLARETSEITPRVLGNLAASVAKGYETEVSETGVLGVVGSELNYALPVEIGVQPRPRRLHQRAKESASAFEHRLQRAGPTTKGFAGRRMYALTLASQDAAIQRAFNAAAEKIAARITGAA